MRWIDLTRTDTTEIVHVATGEPMMLEMEDGAVYHISFDAQDGNVIDIAVVPRSGTTVDTLMVLLNPNNEPLVGDDDGGTNGGSEIHDYRLPETGVYMLVVSAAGGNAVGPVEVRIAFEDNGFATLAPTPTLVSTEEK
jgi:hypothetical protein